MNINISLVFVLIFLDDIEVDESLFQDLEDLDLDKNLDLDDED